jgi:hypothetical protein
LTKKGERVRDGGIEAEANFLGGMLLVPNEAAIHIVGNGLLHIAQNLYGVSPAMLTFRLRMSGANRIYEGGCCLGALASDSDRDVHLLS